MSDPLFNDYAERNKGPILEVLKRVLPATGVVLELASGSGQHVVHFAEALPDLHWLPSEPDSAQRASISAHIERSGLSNVEQPVDLDALADWPVPFVDAVIVANLLHITPPETVAAVCQGSASVLRPGGVLHIYGPFKRHGAHTSEGNVAFDADLRRRNPAWGIRELERVVDAARVCGFTSREINEMPANNFSLVFDLT